MSSKFHHRQFVINVSQHMDKGLEWFAYTREKHDVSVTFNWNGPRMVDQGTALRHASSVIDKAIK